MVGPCGHVARYYDDWTVSRLLSRAGGRSPRPPLTSQPPPVLMPRFRRYIWLPLFGALALATIAVTAGAVPLTHAAHRVAFVTAATKRPSAQSARGRWVAAWSASPETASDKITYAGGFSDETIRNVIYTSAAGNIIRVQLSNAFGDQPLHIGRAAIGSSHAAGSVAGNQPLTFRGQRSVLIPVGGTVLSDPIHLAIHPLESLAVSVFVPQPTGPPTDHAFAQEVNFVAPGDHVMDRWAVAFGAQTSSWYFVTGLQVRHSPEYLGSLVAFGDSITDGAHSTIGANKRWPNDLARRLGALPVPTLSVVDAGISGNRLLTPSLCCGESGVSRFEHDALGQPAVRAVIVLEGVNDIGATRWVTVPEMIAGYERLIQEAHAAGVKIFGATLTPFRGARYWTPAGEVKRDKINWWIRHSHAFDGVVDFAAAVADPGHPERYRPAFDSGDHLHPNNAGYLAMARSVNLASLLHAVNSQH